MKTSVLIPCTPAHVVHLGRVIEAYLRGTVVPYEIICVICDIHSVPGWIVDGYMSRYGDMPFHIVGCEQWRYTGEACNIGEEVCEGDIIMIQAADDLPHKRRVEIVQRFFHNYDIVALNHSYYGMSQLRSYGLEALEKEHIIDAEIKVVQPHQTHTMVAEYPDDVYGQKCGFRVAAGTICYNQKVAKEIEWSSEPKGQDTTFCKEVARKYSKSIIIDAPLYYYFK